MSRLGLPALVREPLVQFALIGLALWGLDHALSPVRDDPRRIEITEAVTTELAATFQKLRGRLPDAAEMADLRQTWLQNEVLYRQGMALQIDKGDVMIRERVIQKMSVLVHGGATVEKPDESVLRAWFQERADDYALPALLTFRMIQTDAARDAAAAKAAEINAANQAGVQPPGPRLRSVGFVNRSHDNVLGLFGAPFTAALEAAPVNTWVPIESPRGWQLVLIEERTPKIMRPYEDVAEAVLTDWKVQAAKKAAWEAMNDLVAEYDVTVPDYDPARVDQAAVDRLVGTNTAASESRIK